jgi:LPXTG-site transpeptidase (sortase) family protein
MKRHALSIFLLFILSTLILPVHAVSAAHPSDTWTSSSIQTGNQKSNMLALVRPARLVIPRLGVNASIEAVGKTTGGIMDVPSGPDSVAWYEPGTLPGRPGNAVIAGHLDSRTGPAVFYSVAFLKQGDAIQVQMSDGQMLNFTVKEVVRYKEKDAPIEAIFGFKEQSGLNLITCGGFFDQATRNYDERVVVYTELRAIDTLRTLGSPVSGMETRNGYPSQYYEKAVVEDHASDTGIGKESSERYQYGLLVDQLHQARSTLPVGGDQSEVTYATINIYADKARYVAPPAGFGGNVHTYADGTVFIPFTADLSPAPGHTVPGYFWQYMNRGDLFPRGWLKDIGLPISEPIQARVIKNFPEGPIERTIIIQAFQRTILTYDAANPAEWQVERANIGTDYYIKAKMR